MEEINKNVNNKVVLTSKKFEINNYKNKFFSQIIANFEFLNLKMKNLFHRTISDQIAYYDAETQSENTLFFIHGFPFNKDMWLPQIEHFKTQFRCIAVDVKGHGLSTSDEEDFSVSGFADDIISLLNDLKIAKVILAGLSMGGYIALNLVTRFPERVSGLILSGTNCIADTPEAKEKRMKTIESLPKIGMEVYAKESVKNLFAPDSLLHKQAEVQLIRAMIENTSEITIVKTLKALANREETCSKLENIKQPTLVLVGENDTVTPFAHAEILWDKMPNSKLFVIENAGHIANLENTSEFNQIIDYFLKDYFLNTIFEE